MWHRRETRRPTEKTNLNLSYRKKPVYSTQYKATQLNTALIKILREAETIFIAGEALSHCVANTVRDMASYMGKRHVKNFVLLKDCTSSVSGFEHFGEAFIDELTSLGMRLENSTDF